MPLVLSGGHRACLPQITCRLEQARSFTQHPLLFLHSCRGLGAPM